MIKLLLYNGGLKSEVNLPCEESKLGSVLKSIELPEDKEVVYLSKIISPSELKIFDNQFVNVDELNYLAKRMDSFIQEEMDKYYAVLKSENINNLKDMINLTFNMHAYTLIQDMRDIEAVGKKHYLTTHICASVPDMEKTDFKKIGQDLINSGNGVLTEKGLLFKNDGVEQQEIYDGKVFPQYSFNGSELLCVAVEYGGKSEFVYLPDNPIAIEKAIKRLSAPDADSCSYRLEYFNYENAKWSKKFEKLISEEDIYKINILTDELNSADIDLDKLDAVIKYALYKKPILNESVDVITELAKHIDDFNILEKVYDLADVGQKIIEMSEEYSLSPELEDYFDFESFGSDFSDDNCGELIDSKFVYTNGYTTLEDILSEELNLKLGGI